MFRSKKDVDKHVADIYHKIKNPTERTLKGYSVAKLYYQVITYLPTEENRTVPYLYAVLYGTGT